MCSAPPCLLEKCSFLFPQERDGGCPDMGAGQGLAWCLCPAPPFAGRVQRSLPAGAPWLQAQWLPQIAPDRLNVNSPEVRSQDQHPPAALGGGDCLDDKRRPARLPAVLRLHASAPGCLRSNGPANLFHPWVDFFPSMYRINLFCAPRQVRVLPSRNEHPAVGALLGGIGISPERPQARPACKEPC